MKNQETNAQEIYSYHVLNKINHKKIVKIPNKLLLLPFQMSLVVVFFDFFFFWKQGLFLFFMVTFIRKKHILAGKTDEEEVKECIENGYVK